MATQTLQSSPSSGYFVNACVDCIFIGGTSIVTYILLALWYTHMRTPTVIAAASFLMWIVNWPHFSMSTYRLYQSRAHVQQYPFTAYGIPLLVFGGIALAFAYPAQVAPYFIKVFLIWSPYHFSGQTIGITLIYARRFGVHIGPWERRALGIFVYGTYFVSTLRAEISRAGHQYYGIQYPGFGVPPWMVEVSTLGMWGAGLALLVAIAYWCYRRKRVMPVMVVLPALTQYIWFVQAIYMPSFQEFVPMFHSLQYILIAWGVQLKEKMDIRGISPSRRYVVTETVRWSVLNVLGGMTLFFVLPKLGVLAGYNALFSLGVVHAAIQIHHFFVDGVIWKLRKQTVAHPLMMHIDDVLHSPRIAGMEKS